MLRPTALVSCLLLAVLTQVAWAAENTIVHDAEYYILKAQHGEQWDTEDDELDAKLANLRQKFGASPNIIHIMWDDTPVGEVGIPALQQLRGFTTPNINRLAREGILFNRMYTEPSCTPSRAAVITGRHPVRNGMYNVGFPYEYGGLAANEVTMAEVLSKSGYSTAFFGKAHLGDVEESYMTKQGFDEAVWTPYNQFPIIYGPKAEITGGVSPTTTNPEIYPEDQYDIDQTWRVDGQVSALSGTKNGPVNEIVRPGDIDGWYKMMEGNKDRTIAFVEKSQKAILCCILA